MSTVTVRETVCQGCGAVISYQGQGRPRRWCTKCGAKQRAYREGLTCSEYGAPTTRIQQGICQKCEHHQTPAGECVVCGDPLAYPVADYTCGFCREELEA